jgi:hypothetical protein
MFYKIVQHYYSNLKLGCLHPVACIRSVSGVSVERNSVSIVVYYFIQIMRYILRSYDHLQVEIYTRKFNLMAIRPKHVADNVNKIVNNY